MCAICLLMKEGSGHGRPASLHTLPCCLTGPQGPVEVVLSPITHWTDYPKALIPPPRLLEALLLQTEGRARLFVSFSGGGDRTVLIFPVSPLSSSPRQTQSWGVPRTGQNAREGSFGGAEWEWRKGRHGDAASVNLSSHSLRGQCCLFNRSASCLWLLSFLLNITGQIPSISPIPAAHPLLLLVFSCRFLP